MEQIRFFKVHLSNQLSSFTTPFEPLDRFFVIFARFADQLDEPVIWNDREPSPTPQKKITRSLVQPATIHGVQKPAR